MIRTYDDITTIDRQTITTAEEAEDWIRAAELREEAIMEMSSPDGQPVEYLRAGAYGAEGLEVIYIPRAERAGVAWGGDAQWTDADSADDALERYFGVDEKEMIP